MPQFVDLTGKLVGRLVPQWPVGKSGRSIVWLCLCSCGRFKAVFSAKIRKGCTISCGCFRRNRLGQKNRTHGYSGKKSLTYSSWLSMRMRCKGNTPHRQKYYANRGITICERWLKFENFLEDMGERPVGKTLDRVDNNGHYEPSNCRWATKTQQAYNRRKREVTLKHEAPARHAPAVAG
jgi:hypothetical protein